MEGGQAPHLSREAAGGGGQEAQHAGQQQHQRQGGTKAAGGSVAGLEGAPPQRRPRILLAATGSVATIKLAQLAQLLLQVHWVANRLLCMLCASCSGGPAAWMHLS